MRNNTSQHVETSLSGYELLNDPLLNKGTAFTEDERNAFDLQGLLPPHVAELDYQVMRRLDAFRGLGSDIQRYVFLRRSAGFQRDLVLRAVDPEYRRDDAGRLYADGRPSAASCSAISFASRAGCFSASRTGLDPPHPWSPATTKSKPLWSATASAFSGLGDQARRMGIRSAKLALTPRVRACSIDHTADPARRRHRQSEHWPIRFISAGSTNGCVARL